MRKCYLCNKRFDILENSYIVRDSNNKTRYYCERCIDKIERPKHERKAEDKVIENQEKLIEPFSFVIFVIIIAIILFLIKTPITNILEIIAGMIGAMIGLNYGFAKRNVKHYK